MSETDVPISAFKACDVIMNTALEAYLMSKMLDVPLEQAAFATALAYSDDLSHPAGSKRTMFLASLIYAICKSQYREALEEFSKELIEKNEKRWREAKERMAEMRNAILQKDQKLSKFRPVLQYITQAFA